MNCFVGVYYSRSLSYLQLNINYRYYTESFETDKLPPNTINQTGNISQYNNEKIDAQNNQNIDTNLSFKVKTIKVPITDQQSEIESIEIRENLINNVRPVDSQYEFLYGSFMNDIDNKSYNLQFEENPFPEPCNNTQTSENNKTISSLNIETANTDMLNINTATNRHLLQTLQHMHFLSKV